MTMLGKGFSVLIVEDNIHMMRLLSAMIRSIGVDVIHAVQDPTDALEVMKTNAIDFAIVDLRLPVIDGIEFTMLVRNSPDSPNPYLPIIMVTAHSEREKVEAARDAGVNEFCCKPITANTLFSRIHAIIEHPRPFIRSAHYFGPDRRRHKDPQYRGPERRADHQSVDL